MLLHTTRELLHTHEACTEGYRDLIKTIGSDYPKDKPISLITVLESNGLDDALWCLRAVLPEQEKDRDRIALLMACDFAEAVLPIFEKERPKDGRPRQAIVTVRLFVDGNTTQADVLAARNAAWDAAASAAGAAWAAAGSAAGATRAAAWDAAASAARDAAWAAAWDAARAAARDAAWDAAWYAARDAQKKIFRRYLTEEAQQEAS